MSGQCRAASSATVPGTGDCAQFPRETLYTGSGRRSAQVLPGTRSIGTSVLCSPGWNVQQGRHSKSGRSSRTAPSSTPARTPAAARTARSGCGQTRAGAYDLHSQLSDRWTPAMQAGRVPVTATRPRIPKSPVWLDAERPPAPSGVGARMRAGLRASNRRARHLPMRYETGLPSSVIRFRTLHASTASRRCPDELRARRQSPTIDLYRKNACSTRAC